MKQCPVCKTTYTDDSIAFCLEDGANLQSITLTASSFPTEQVSAEMNRNRVNIPVNNPTVVVPQSAVNSASPEKSKSWVLALVGLGVIALLVSGIIGLIYFLKSNGKEVSGVSVNSNSANSNSVSSNSQPNSDKTVSENNKPNSSNANRINDETAKLKEKLEKLEKQLAEQQKASSGKSSTAPPVVEHQAMRTATANSPNDGYLALRTAPSSTAGRQILKIPHGETVTVGNCLDVVKADGKTGRWCQVIYNEQAGWAFDGFLRY